MTPPLLYRGIKQLGVADDFRELSATAQAQLWTELGKRYHSYTHSSLKKRHHSLRALHLINDRLIKLAGQPSAESHFEYLTKAVLKSRLHADPQTHQQKR